MKKKREQGRASTSTRREAESGDRSQNENIDASNTIKDPADWKTGDEPMTGAQRSYLRTLASEAKEDVPEQLTKAEASARIDELQQRTGRGLNDVDASASPRR